MSIPLLFQGKFTKKYFKKLCLPKNSIAALRWVISGLVTLGHSLSLKEEMNSDKLCHNSITVVAHYDWLQHSQYCNQTLGDFATSLWSEIGRSI